MRKRILPLALIFGAIIIAGSFWPVMQPVEAQYRDAVYTLQLASGDQTTARTSVEVPSRLSAATIRLDITKLTLADADDEVDFYVQTTYSLDSNSIPIWVDCQNFHFKNADNGATAKKSAVIDGAIDGPGTDKSIAGTNPAAGSEISETVPANAVWMVGGIYASLVTDANAANRRVHVLVDDGATTFYRSVSASVQAESLTHYYSIGPHGITAAVADTVHWIPLPPGMVLSAGSRIQTSTALIEAGDNWGAPQLSVTEWHNPSVLTDATIRDNVKSYERPLGTHVRIKTAVTGASAPTYAYSATVFFK